MNKQNGQPAHSRQLSNVGRRRSVAPAIPLSHEKRLAAKRAANKAAKTTAETATAEPDQPLSPQAVEKDNGTGSVDATVNGVELETGPEVQSALDAVDEPATSEGPSDSKTETSVIDSTSGQTNDSFTESTPDKSDDTMSHVHNPSQFSESLVTPASNIRPPPVVPPTRYEMPPTSRPGGLPLNMVVNAESGRGEGPLPASARSYHHTRPSTSSVQFGEFGESQSSSPVPLNNGAFAQPPGPSLPNGRHFAGPSHGHPYQAIMPAAPDMSTPGNLETYGRVQGPDTVEGIQHFGNGGVDHRGQHGVGGSQSSGLHDDTYGHYPVSGFVNGHTPMNSIHSRANHGSLSGPPGLPVMIPDSQLHHMGPSFEESQNLVQHLQKHFGNPELCDVVLELRFVDGRALPVRISGHRILLSRSPRLFELLQRQNGLQASMLQFPQSVVLETDDKWVRSDSFYMAVQSLYGFPLLPMLPPRNGQNGDVIGTAGSAEEQFGFALSYIAAGHLLHWRPVAQRGCEAAAKLLSWDTVERGLDFALEAHSDKGSHIVYKYGRESDFLLHEVVGFLARRIPVGASLDTAVTDPGSYSRMPPGVTQPFVSATPQEDAPIQLGSRPRSQKVSGIKFGDLSLQETPNGFANMGAARPGSSGFDAVLSRILISVPFIQLKLFVDMTRSNQWADAETFSRIVKQAVQARELRRQHALQAVLEGTLPNADSIKQCLRSPEPRNYDRWSMLGWEEETKDGFSVSRKWVPVVEAGTGPTLAFP